VFCRSCILDWFETILFKHLENNLDYWARWKHHIGRSPFMQLIMTRNMERQPDAPMFDCPACGMDAQLVPSLAPVHNRLANAVNTFRHVMDTSEDEDEQAAQWEGLRLHILGCI
jgi:hypothetical protein